MNIKTSLQVSALYPIVLAIMVSLSLFLRARHVSRSEHISGSVLELAKNAADFQAALINFEPHQGGRSRQVWEERRAMLLASLGMLNVKSSVNARILKDRIVGLVRRMEETVAEIDKAPRLLQH